MEPEPTAFRKRVIRNIENTDPMAYMLSRDAKIDLEYPESCLEEPDRSVQRPLLAVDCEMVATTLGEELVSITIVDADQQVLLHESVRPEGKIVNPRTEITGLKEQDILGYPKTLREVRPQIANLIQGKVLVGHDLCNDMRVLGIPHQCFIDTVGLFPHKDKLPFKSKLRDLSMNILKQPIQYGKHNPVEDAVAALRLAKWHISNGRGTVEYVPGREVTPMTLEDICFEAELNPLDVLVLILRGSRAGGFEDTQSDYDYVMAYDTTANLDGALITLFNVDIAFYDKKSFSRLLTDQDISILQIFASGQKHQLRSQVVLPAPDLIKLRESTTFHVYRALNKSRRMIRKPNVRKALKSIHMAYRFYDFYGQIAQHGRIVEHRRQTPLWFEIKEEWQKHPPTALEQLHAKWMAAIDQYAQAFRKKYPTIRRVTHDEDEQLQAKTKVRKEKLANPQRYQRSDLAEGDLNLRAYLLDSGCDYIESDYRVRVQQHCIYPNLLQFHYLQSADFSKRIPCESRGVILDEASKYQVVAFPYFKFFDYNDRNCDMQRFQWEGSELYEKLDGSTATLYYYLDGWHVASSTKPDGAGDYCFAGDHEVTAFSQEFWRVFYERGYRLPSNEDKDKTFVFELLSTRHLIVVNHKVDRLVLHGCRQIPSLRELLITPYGGQYGWQVVQPLKLEYANIDDVVKIASALDPRVCQGFILKDRNNMRVKIKCPHYLLLSWVNPINNNIITDKSLLEIIVRGQQDTFVKYCPQWKNAIQRLIEPLESIKRHVFDTLQGIFKDVGEREFAARVKKQDKKLHPLLFSARKGDLTELNFYAELGVKRLAQLLDCGKPIGTVSSEGN